MFLYLGTADDTDMTLLLMRLLWLHLRHASLKECWLNVNSQWVAGVVMPTGLESMWSYFCVHLVVEQLYHLVDVSVLSFPCLLWS